MKKSIQTVVKLLSIVNTSLNATTNSAQTAGLKNH